MRLPRMLLTSYHLFCPAMICLFADRNQSICTNKCKYSYAVVWPPVACLHAHISCRGRFAATSLLTEDSAAGVLGLDNFNDYYPVALKRARQVRSTRLSRPWTHLSQTFPREHTVPSGDACCVQCIGSRIYACKFTTETHAVPSGCNVKLFLNKPI